MEIAQKHPPFNAHPRVRRELATGQEGDGCNKRFSLSSLAVLHKPRVFLESSTLQVCQSYSLSLLDPMRKVCSCPGPRLARFLSRYTQRSLEIFQSSSPRRATHMQRRGVVIRARNARMDHEAEAEPDSIDRHNIKCRERTLGLRQLC